MNKQPTTYNLQQRKKKPFLFRFPIPSTLTPKPSSSGFTLIETLVAITILLLAIVGPMTIAARGLFSSNVARDQITAFYLAQDAVEFVRKVRDSNALASPSQDWLTGLTDDCLGGKKCMFQTHLPLTDALAIEECPVSGCPPLRFDYDPLTQEGSRFYGYDLSWTETGFVRTVGITQTGDEVDVEVTISWRTGVIPRTFTVHENLLDWQ